MKHLNEVTHAGKMLKVAQPVSFRNLLPSATRRLFRYRGSLTTPPCSKIVTWSVFQFPIHVTSYQVANRVFGFIQSKFIHWNLQLEQFGQLTNDEGNPLINNNRHVQPINNRDIDSGV